MSNQQTVLTTLCCAGSLAAILATTSPAMASSAIAGSAAASSATAPDLSLDYGLPTLVQNESNPIGDALGCTCARCLMANQQSIL